MGSQHFSDSTGFHSRPAEFSLLPAVFFVSFATMGWQLALMRCLLISRYHHFSFLIIGCALLGFAASGTVLSLCKPWIDRNGNSIFSWGIVGFGISLPLCFRLGQMLPLEVYFPPGDLFASLGWWFGFWLVNSVPFLIAGLLIGLALILRSGDSHKVYAANLVGSAAGALAVIELLCFFSPNTLVVPFALLVTVSGFLLSRHLSSWDRKTYRPALWIVCLLLLALYAIGAGRVFPLSIDQYKPLAFVTRLVSQGDAQKQATFLGPRGVVELFTGPHFHTLLSLSSRTAPPPMDVLIRDGFNAGSILSIQHQDQARFLEGTLSALPYKLIRPRSVLILGETGGTYVWLARLSKADSIVVVQPDTNIVSALRSHSSGVLNDPRVRVVVAEPRAFLDSTTLSFDIIHLVAIEGFSPGSAGIGSLREDYVATVEGFSKCLGALTSGGIASVVRGIQDPPRDNVKIPATWIEAMESRGIERPEDRIVMARDELAVATVVSRSPFTGEQVHGFRQTCETMSWDVEWFPGITPDQTNKVHVLPGPEGRSVSWYHHAMRELLSKDRGAFYRNWITHVVPATDDRPFFHDFFRWASVSMLREVFGPMWPARSEMGFLVLVLATIWTAAAATILLPGPVILLLRGREAPPRAVMFWAIVYFACLGTAFMFLEMSFIQAFTRFLGDPVPATALVVGGFLFFAGAGSMAQPQVTSRLPGGVFLITSAIACIVVVDSISFPHLFETAAALPDFWKTVMGLAIIAPLAFCMGVPFPWGLYQVHQRAGAVIPIAWAVNGFASVVSTSAAVLLTMAYGFKTLFTLAAGIYALAGALSIILAPGKARGE